MTRSEFTQTLEVGDIIRVAKQLGGGLAVTAAVTDVTRASDGSLRSVGVSYGVPGDPLPVTTRVYLEFVTHKLVSIEDDPPKEVTA